MNTNISSYLAGAIVKVIVGEDDTSASFFLHEDLVTSRSCFFRKALKTYGEDGSLQWREGEERIVKLPEDEPRVFASYVQLLYLGKLPIHKALTDIETKDSNELKKLLVINVEQEYMLLARLYVFCEKVQDTKSKAAVISAFVEASCKSRANGLRHYPHTAAISCIYKGTPELDPLRDVLVDFWIFHAHSGWTGPEKVDDYPHEFTYEVMKGLIKEREKPEAPARSRDAAYYCEKLRHHDGEDD